MPAGQAVALVELRGQKYPEGHAMGVLKALGQKKPGGQGTQVSALTRLPPASATRSAP